MINSEKSDVCDVSQPLETSATTTSTVLLLQTENMSAGRNTSTGEIGHTELVDTLPASLETVLQSEPSEDNDQSNKDDDAILKISIERSSDTSHAVAADAEHLQMRKPLQSSATAEKDAISFGGTSELTKVEVKEVQPSSLPRASVTIIDGVVITERPITWRQRLRTLLPILVMLVVYAVILILFFIFQSRIFPVLQSWAGWLKDAKVGGIAILAAAIMITSFPPIPGYSILGIFCGYVYGVWFGFVPLVIGAYLGALVSFVVLRRYLSKFAEGLFEENPKIALVVRAVEGKGIKLLWIMRVAPYPYNLMNGLCAASSIPFKNYAIATLLATPKLFLETSIGSGVQSLSEGFTDHLTWEKILQLSLTLVLGIGVTLYVVWLARRVIKKYKKEQALQNQGLNTNITMEEGNGSSRSFTFK